MNEPTIEPGPFLWRVPGRAYSPAQPNNPRRWSFPPYGLLEGFEIWIDEPLVVTDARTLLELETRLFLDGRIIEVPSITARYRNAIVNGRAL